MPHTFIGGSTTTLTNNCPQALTAVAGTTTIVENTTQMMPMMPIPAPILRALAWMCLPRTMPASPMQVKISETTKENMCGKVLTCSLSATT